MVRPPFAAVPWSRRVGHCPPLIVQFARRRSRCDSVPSICAQAACRRHRDKSQTIQTFMKCSSTTIFPSFAFQRHCRWAMEFARFFCRVAYSRANCLTENWAQSLVGVQLPTKDPHRVYCAGRTCASFRTNSVDDRSVRWWSSVMWSAPQAPQATRAYAVVIPVVHWLWTRTASQRRSVWWHLAHIRVTAVALLVGRAVTCARPAFWRGSISAPALRFEIKLIA